MQVVDKYGNTFGQGHLIITSKSGKSKLPVVTVAWGNITGALSDQIDLQDALNLKVPTARTITINGITQDLTVNRTWTISTGITIDTTPIAGGTVGRLLFEGTGNVVQESPSIFWDIAGSKLNLGSLGVQGELVINRASNGGTIGGLKAEASGAGVHIGGGGYLDSIILSNGSGVWINTWTGSGSGSAERLRITGTTGNVLINTTTDSGFKLDVNGSSTFRGEIRLNANIATGGNRNYLLGNSGDFEVTTNTNIKFRNYYNGSDVYFSMAYGLGGRALFSGLTSANGYRLATSGNVIPEAAVARGVFFNNTLVAAANNDVLVGLDIVPTYTNGAFTGLANIDLRTKNAGFVIGSGYGYGALYGYNNDGIIQVVDGGTSTLNGGSHANQIWLRPAGNPGGYNSNYWATLEQSSNGFLINSGRYNSNIFLKAGRTGSNGNIYFNNAGATMAMLFGATSNFAIGTTTDAGFKLDVNGTSRLQGLTTFGSTNDFLISGTTVVNKGITRPAGNGNGIIFSENMQAGQIAFQFVGGGSLSGNSKGFLNIGGRSVFNINVGLGNPNTNNLDASVLLLDGIHNVTSFSGTIIRGIYYNPTLTSLVGVISHRAIQTTSGDILFGTTSGSVGIGANTLINQSAILDVTSTTQGFLPPRMTNAQMLAIATPAEGLMVYDLTNRKLCCYDGATWQNLF